MGRSAELGEVADVLARVREGRPWLVAIEGESGIGKTALARRCVGSLSDATVLWGRSDPAETDLEYGVVEQLLRGVDAQVLARYPLLAAVAGASSPFGVGAQLLGVVGDLQAAGGPVVIVVDDVQWADRRSVEALSFMLRRLSADSVLAIMLVRGERDALDDPARRMLSSVERRLSLRLSGLPLEEVADLAAALGADPLDPAAVRLLHEGTGGHTLYLQTVLGDREAWGRLGAGRMTVPGSLAAAIGDQLATLPPATRSMLEMLAVLDAPTPLALVAEGVAEASPKAAIEPAVRAGLADWWPEQPTCPVVIRHALQRDAIYARLPGERRRQLHARAARLVEESAAWAHRVAAIDGPDEDLAAQLERLAETEADRGQLSLAATHLLWAADVSPDRADRERRLLTAVVHLMLTDEARGLTLAEAVGAARPTPLRSCVLGTLAFSTGQLVEAELRFGEALEEARADADARPLAAMIANRLAGTHTLLGNGEEVMAFGRWALETGCLGPAAASQTRTLVAIGASQVGGARQALAELAHLDANAGRVDPVDVDGLSFRGVFQLLAGDLRSAVADLAASVKLARAGATFTFGLRAYSYLGLAQYLAGDWDDVILTAEQGFSAAAIHPRRYELPLLRLVAACVPAGRGATAAAEEHAALAEEAAAVLDYSQERLYAGMARALVCQVAEDYAGMVTALGHWQDESALDGRSRVYGVLWRPLLVEGLVGAGRPDEAEVALRRLHEQAGDVAYLQPGLAWLEGWLAEQQGHPERAAELYRRGEEPASGASPVYEARLLLAYGRLLRRTGQRRQAVERLRRANDLYAALGAAPFVSRAQAELAACGLPSQPAKRGSVLEMTSRESEVAHLVAQRMTNNEIAAELFITPNTVEYHLGNIYAKLGVKGRRELRGVLAESRQPAEG